MTALLLALLAVAPKAATRYSIAFDGGPAAVVDAGRLHAAPAGETVFRRSFHLRVEGPMPGRFVRLSASVQNAQGCSFRVDGVPLEEAPRVIDALAPVGKSVAHTLEVVVPGTAPAGALATSVGFIAESN